jgi:hypothetical protein
VSTTDRSNAGRKPAGERRRRWNSSTVTRSGKGLEKATLRTSGVTEAGTPDRNPVASASVEMGAEEVRHL